MGISELDKNVAKDSAKFFHRMKKQSVDKTPPLLKIIVAVDVWIVLTVFLKALSLALQHSYPVGQIITGILGTGLMLVALIAIWNLRKWGIYLLAGVTCLSIGSTIDYPMSNRAFMIFILVRLAIVLPPLAYWKKMR